MDDSVFDVIALGEVIVDFTQVGISENGQALYERNPGGAPANMIAMCAALGLNCAFVGSVGADAQGLFLRDVLSNAHVNIDGLINTDDAFTTLSFVQIDPMTGERSFAFARTPGADTQLKVDKVDLNRIRAAQVLHVGSLALTDNPSRTTTFEVIEIARRANTLISFDPNWRPTLWHDSNHAVALLNQMATQCDLMKASLDEAELLTCDNTGSKDATKSATTSNISNVTRAVIAGSALLHRDRGPALVAITMGDEGAFIATSKASTFVAAYKPTAMVDTTGAGDVFWGAFVGWLINKAHVRTRNDLELLDAATLAQAGDFACAAASLSVEKHGGIPSIPSPDEIAMRLTSGQHIK